jgi:hypothetical protein
VGLYPNQLTRLRRLPSQWGDEHLSRNGKSPALELIAAGGCRIGVAPAFERDLERLVRVLEVL